MADRYIVNGRVVVDTQADVSDNEVITGVYTFDTAPTFNEPLVLPNNSHISTFELIYQASEPTTRGSGDALVVGDRWYDGDKESRWNGSKWVYGEETIIFYLAALDKDATTLAKAAVLLYVPYNLEITDLVLKVDTAPVGSAFVVDLNVDGASILSTPITIDDGEVSSETAATPYVLSTTQIAQGSTITVDVDQVGAVTAGQNPTLVINGVRY